MTRTTALAIQFLCLAWLYAGVAYLWNQEWDSPGSVRAFLVGTLVVWTLFVAAFAWFTRPSYPSKSARREDG